MEQILDALSVMLNVYQNHSLNSKNSGQDDNYLLLPEFRNGLALRMGPEDAEASPCYTFAQIIGDGEPCK